MTTKSGKCCLKKASTKVKENTAESRFEENRQWLYYRIIRNVINGGIVGHWVR